MSDGIWTTCCTCKQQMWVPSALNNAALAARDRIAFYCAYGHSNVYVAGESDEGKLRRENQRLIQRLAEKDDEIKYQSDARAHTERQLTAQRGVVTRIKNRVGHGVCPCCSRTFENLGKHMHTKHPEYAKSDVILQAAE